MKLAFVGTRNGKPALNLAFALLAAVLLVAICVGISLVLGALAPEMPMIGTVGWAISTVVPLMIVLGGVIRGFNTPAEQLPKLD